MNSANTQESAAVSNACLSRPMSHSISLNTLGKQPSVSPTAGFLAPDANRSANPASALGLNIYSRYSPQAMLGTTAHGGSSGPQHSHSSVNLIGAGAAPKHSSSQLAQYDRTTSSSRQSATNGIKMIPSSQVVGSGSRTASPSTSLLMAQQQHHQ